MRGSRNFHERGSNENGNFWSQTRGGPPPKKSRNYLFLGKIFKFQGGSGPPVPPLDPRMSFFPDGDRTRFSRVLSEHSSYHVAVKAGLYRKAVQVCYIPIPCDISITLKIFCHCLEQKIHTLVKLHYKKRHSCIGNETEMYENRNQ